MMKKLLLLFVLMINVSLYATESIIRMREDKITQMIFSSNIKSFKGGFMPSDFAISTEENVLYIQPVGSFKESNMNIITEDGCYYAFTVRYDPEATRFNFVFSPEDAIYKESVSNQNTTEPVSEAQTVKEDKNLIPVCEKIEALQGYLINRNIQRLKNFAVIVKGVYTDANYMYFKVIFENSSNIPYDIDLIGFYIETIVKGKRSTTEKFELKPIYVYNQLPTVDPKNKFEAIYCFEKFTIGKDKAFTISTIERNGERNIELQLHNEIIIQAKKYE